VAVAAENSAPLWSPEVHIIRLALSRHLPVSITCS